MSDRFSVVCADAVAFLASLPSGSVDAVISDPPYPEIDRPYGRLTEAEWHALMRAVVGETRRVLKPRGSAVFILQPNSERVGRMRPWLWEFMAWTAKEWNQVQDAWWWNYTAIPDAFSIQGKMMRASVKACVWLGGVDCHRNQDAVLWTESNYSTAGRLAARAGKQSHKRPTTCGRWVEEARVYESSSRRGGVTPFNLLPINNANPYTSGGGEGHAAATPLELAAWWTRYIAPVGGHVVDPFCGSGTMLIAALEHGATCAGADKEAAYVEIARRRASRAAQQGVLFGAPPSAPPATPATDSPGGHQAYLDFRDEPRSREG